MPIYELVFVFIFFVCAVSANAFIKRTFIAIKRNDPNLFEELTDNDMNFDPYYFSITFATNRYSSNLVKRIKNGGVPSEFMPYRFPYFIFLRNVCYIIFLCGLIKFLIGVFSAIVR